MPEGSEHELVILGSGSFATETVLCRYDGFLEDIRLAAPSDRLPAAQHLGYLLGAHEPVGQLDVMGVDALRHVSEGVAVLAVGIEHHHVAIRVGLQERAQHDRERAGFTRASRAQDGRMLAEEFLRDQIGRLGWILVQHADRQAW